METALLFKSALDLYDQAPFKPVLENEIYNALQRLIPEGYGDLSLEEKAELIAFRFVTPGRRIKQQGSFYFQPVTRVENEDGSVKEFPDPAMVTRETITYWVERLKLTQHPVLAARYAGVICDFSMKLTKKQAHYSITRKYLQSLLAVLDQQLYKVPVYAIEWAGRALEVALLLNDPVLIDQCKLAILQLENEIAVPDKPGLWGFSYDLLMGRKKMIVSEAEELDIVQGLEAWLKTSLMTDCWCAECAAERLMSYYFRKGRSADVKRVIEDMETAFENSTLGGTNFSKAHSIEKLYGYCKKYQLNAEAEAYLKRVREISKLTSPELKSVSTGMSVSKEQIDKYVDLMLKGENSEVVFYRIIEGCTPRIQEENRNWKN